MPSLDHTPKELDIPVWLREYKSATAGRPRLEQYLRQPNHPDAALATHWAEVGSRSDDPMSFANEKWPHSANDIVSIGNTLDYDRNTIAKKIDALNPPHDPVVAAEHRDALNFIYAALQPHRIADPVLDAEKRANDLLAYRGVLVAGPD